MLKTLKGNPRTREIPVLFVSLETEGESNSVLALDYLTKPVGADELARALERQGICSDQGSEIKTVLLVDDDLDVLDLHARMVTTQLGIHNVLTAQNGRQALELMQGERPDLVLLDLMMPEMDGFTVLERMRDDPATRNVPVVVLTACVLDEDDMKRLNRGVAAVLRKGVFSVPETMEQVATVLNRSERVGRETQRLVRRAMAFLHEHYAESISRQDVANYVGINSDYLTRCFSQELGMSLLSYLNRYRVEQAKLLLETGEMSVTQVAMDVGFSDPSYFGRIFRREVGASPSKYQRNRAGF